MSKFSLKYLDRMSTLEIQSRDAYLNTVFGIKRVSTWLVPLEKKLNLAVQYNPNTVDININEIVFAVGNGANLTTEDYKENKVTWDRFVKYPSVAKFSDIDTYGGLFGGLGNPIPICTAQMSFLKYEAYRMYAPFMHNSQWMRMFYAKRPIEMNIMSTLDKDDIPVKIQHLVCNITKSEIQAAFNLKKVDSPAVINELCLYVGSRVSVSSTSGSRGENISFTTQVHPTSEIVNVAPYCKIVFDDIKIEDIPEYGINFILDIELKAELREEEDNSGEGDGGGEPVVDPEDPNNSTDPNEGEGGGDPNENGGNSGGDNPGGGTGNGGGDEESGGNEGGGSDPDEGGTGGDESGGEDIGSETVEEAAQTFRTTYASILAKTVDNVTREDRFQITYAFSAYDSLDEEVQKLLEDELEHLKVLRRLFIALKNYKNTYPEVFSLSADDEKQTIVDLLDEIIEAIERYELLDVNVQRLLESEHTVLLELKEIAESTEDNTGGDNGEDNGGDSGGDNPGGGTTPGNEDDGYDAAGFLSAFADLIDIVDGNTTLYLEDVSDTLVAVKGAITEYHKMSTEDQEEIADVYASLVSYRNSLEIVEEYLADYSDVVYLTESDITEDNRDKISEAIDEWLNFIDEGASTILSGVYYDLTALLGYLDSIKTPNPTPQEKAAQFTAEYKKYIDIIDGYYDPAINIDDIETLRDEFIEAHNVFSDLAQEVKDELSDYSEEDFMKIIQALNTVLSIKDDYEELLEKDETNIAEDDRNELTAAIERIAETIYGNDCDIISDILFDMQDTLEGLLAVIDLPKRTLAQEFIDEYKVGILDSPETVNISDPDVVDILKIFKTEYENVYNDSVVFGFVKEAYDNVNDTYDGICAVLTFIEEHKDILDKLEADDVENSDLDAALSLYSAFEDIQNDLADDILDNAGYQNQARDAIVDIYDSVWSDFSDDITFDSDVEIDSLEKITAVQTLFAKIPSAITESIATFQGRSDILTKYVTMIQNAQNIVTRLKADYHELLDADISELEITEENLAEMKQKLADIKTQLELEADNDEDIIRMVNSIIGPTWTSVQNKIDEYEEEHP